MSIWCRLTMPPETPLTVQRIVDLVRLSAAEHYRLIAAVDPESHTFVPLGKCVADFNPLVRVIERVDHQRTWESVLRKELNTNFDTSSPTKPLWKVAMVVSKQVAENYRKSIAQVAQKGGIELSQGASTSQETPTQETTDYTRKPEETFEIFFSFHHCLGDGLSMWAFARTFMKYSHQSFWLQPDLKLDQIPLSTEPPPILDNLMNPGFFEVLPGTSLCYLFSSCL